MLATFLTGIRRRDLLRLPVPQQRCRHSYGNVRHHHWHGHHERKRAEHDHHTRGGTRQYPEHDETAQRGHSHQSCFERPCLTHLRAVGQRLVLLVFVVRFPCVLSFHFPSFFSCRASDAICVLSDADDPQRCLSRGLTIPP